MRETIRQKLAELEAKEDIRILYACESGSRAWGFASPDSDYDVRFIYARKVEDYLSIATVRDVVELPINEVLDISGWDIRKALQLFLKSNAPLYEWLQSPICYLEQGVLLQELQGLMKQYFSLRAGANHYLSMAINTVEGDLQGEQVKLKKYFYALRPLLACQWIIERQEVPPMEFGVLRTLIADAAVQNSIDGLLRRKEVSDEKAIISHVDLIDSWLRETVALCKEKIPALPSKQYTTEELDILFRKSLQR